MSASVWRAPAKLNLTLEVLRRRGDGYHEIRSVVALIDLCDELEVGSGVGFSAVADEDYDASAMPDGRAARNSVETALALMVAERLHRPLDSPAELENALRLGLGQVSLRLKKCIPAAAGLGGGSSDGAAALRALNEYWSMGLNSSKLAELALRIGSDCPLFLQGQTQLVGGRGEQLRSLPAPARFWACVVEPAVARENKTARVYGLLRPDRDFTDGERAEALARRLSGSRRYRLRPDDLFNVFDSVADEAFGSLQTFRRALGDAGARAVHLCGAGPALYGLFERRGQARAAAAALSAAGWRAWTLSNAPVQ